MNQKRAGIDILAFLIILLLAVIALTGALSFRPDHSFSVTNQYGQAVKLFGDGIYARDSYFKAPIFIGTDLSMLILVLPMLIRAQIRKRKTGTVKSKLSLIAVLAVVLYYAASIVFGVTYNSYLLLYIALFSTSFFALIKEIRGLDLSELRKAQCWVLPTKGISVFLILSGISLFIAWLPDIIPTILSGTALPLIEVYTTEITYALDMGVVSPLMFVCLYLLGRKDGLGDILLAIILRLCQIIGVMLPVQTVFQVLAGIEMPIPVLVTKVGIFVVLSIFASYYNFKLYKTIK